MVISEEEMKKWRTVRDVVECIKGKYEDRAKRYDEQALDSIINKVRES